MIDVAQPYAGAFMCALPTSPACRYKSVHWVWAMQRRFGLYVSAAVPTFELLAAQGDGSHDSLGDTLSHAPTTDKSAPHDHIGLIPGRKVSVHLPTEIFSKCQDGPKFQGLKRSFPSRAFSSECFPGG